MKQINCVNVSKYGVISGPYFPVFGPEITSYLDAFHVVISCIEVPNLMVLFKHYFAYLV